MGAHVGRHRRELAALDLRAGLVEQAARHAPPGRRDQGRTRGRDGRTRLGSGRCRARTRRARTTCRSSRAGAPSRRRTGAACVSDPASGVRERPRPQRLDRQRVEVAGLARSGRRHRRRSRRSPRTRPPPAAARATARSASKGRRDRRRTRDREHRRLRGSSAKPAGREQHAHREQHGHGRGDEVPVDVGERMEEIDRQQHTGATPRRARHLPGDATLRGMRAGRTAAPRPSSRPGSPSPPTPGARRCAAPRSRPTRRGSAAARSRTYVRRARPPARPGTAPRLPHHVQRLFELSSPSRPDPGRHRPCRGTRRATLPDRRSQPWRRRRPRPRRRRARRAAGPSGGARPPTDARRRGPRMREAERGGDAEHESEGEPGACAFRVADVWRWSTMPGWVVAHATTQTAGTPAATSIAKALRSDRVRATARDRCRPRRRRCPPAST